MLLNFDIIFLEFYVYCTHAPENLITNIKLLIIILEFQKKLVAHRIGLLRKYI